MPTVKPLASAFLGAFVVRNSGLIGHEPNLFWLSGERRSAIGVISRMIDHIHEGLVAPLRGALLFLPQGAVFVHIGNGRQVLVCDEIAAKRGFSLIRKNDRFHKYSLEPAASVASHIVTS